LPFPIHYFTAGDPPRYPVFLCSAVAMAAIIERWTYLRRARGANESFYREVPTQVHPGGIEDAMGVRRANHALLARVCSCGLVRAARGEDPMRQAIKEVGRWRRR
jgi:biopolymer transport protein ExbB